MANSLRVKISTETFEALNHLAATGHTTPETLASKILNSVAEIWYEAQQFSETTGADVVAVTRWGTSHGGSEAETPVEYVSVGNSEFVPCRLCEGRGSTNGYMCLRCDGVGQITFERHQMFYGRNADKEEQ
jgi:hypothetical protein